MSSTRRRGDCKCKSRQNLSKAAIKYFRLLAQAPNLLVVRGLKSVLEASHSRINITCFLFLSSVRAIFNFVFCSLTPLYCWYGKMATVVAKRPQSTAKQICAVWLPQNRFVDTSRHRCQLWKLGVRVANAAFCGHLVNKFKGEVCWFFPLCIDAKPVAPIPADWMKYRTQWLHATWTSIFTIRAEKKGSARTIWGKQVKNSRSRHPRCFAAPGITRLKASC